MSASAKTWAAMPDATGRGWRNVKFALIRFALIVWRWL